MKIMRRLGLAVLLAAAMNAPAAETMMKAIVTADGKTALRNIAKPTAGPGEVLVRIRAASVNPIDWKLAAGYSGLPGGGSAPAAAPSGGAPPASGPGGGPGAGPPGPQNSGPRISGNDVAGVIEALGAGVTGWKVGDAVFARSGNGYAEYVAVRANELVAKPADLSFAEAAGIPTVAITAWNSIIDVAHLTKGQKILIHGAAGGTGSAAVQVAKAQGAYIIGTASKRNHDYLRSLGVDEVIDYSTEKFEDKVKDVDVVYNTANLETATRSIAVVKKGGFLLSIVGMPNPAQCQAAGITCAARNMQNPTPSAEVLRHILDLAKAGKYEVNVDKTFPLADFEKAWNYGKEGHTRGKIILINES